MSTLRFFTGMSTALPSAGTRLAAVVHDERFAAAIAFAHESARIGSSVHAMDGDITDLWYGNLHYLWQSRAAAVAGLTTHGPLFCLERLGWDYGLRLVFRTAHHEVREGIFEHQPSGRQPLNSEMGALRSAGREWPIELAHSIARRASAVSRPLGDIYLGREAPSAVAMLHDAEPLFSWLLAPVSLA
jgi:hypothetical protein